MSGLKTLGFAVDDHDPRSIELYQFIEDMDYKCGDTFCFKHGGDGDNGELLLSYLDEWFSSKRTCDRAALLALAEDVRGYCIERQITPWVAGRIYDRIREACGEAGHA